MMRGPEEIPAIAKLLAWLAWAACLLTGLAQAADAFNARHPPRRRDDRRDDGSDADVIEIDPEPAAAPRGRRGGARVAEE